jgi:hypothetical protein
MTINESTGTVCTDDARPHLCRQSSWLFLRHPLLCFRWPLPSQEGLCAKMKPSLSWGSSFGDDFRVGSESVFGVDFRVNWDCVRWPIQASAIKEVSLIMSESSATQFSVMITETTGTVCADETKCQLGKQFQWQFSSRQRISFRCRFPSQLGQWALTNPGVSYKSSLVDYVWVVSYIVFGDDYRVNRDCVHGRIRLQLCRRSRWLFLSRQLLCFRWPLPSQEGLCAKTKTSVC